MDKFTFGTTPEARGAAHKSPLRFEEPPTQQPGDVTANANVHAFEEPPTHEPPDITADIDEATLKNSPWHTRLHISWPSIYIPYLVLILGFGIVTIVFGVKARHDLGSRHNNDNDDDSNPGRRSSSPRSLFWSFLAIVSSLIFSISITYEFQYVLVSAFWRRRARAFIQAGAFASIVDVVQDKKEKSETPIVLEIGPHGGSVSAIFAREILQEYRANKTSISIPRFIGYGKWLKSFRLPNGPKCYLQTLFDIGVPRDHIVSNLANPNVHLPYADNSISLIVCNVGMADVCKWFNLGQRRTLTREMARVLKVNGKMIVVEGHAVDNDVKKSLFSWPPGGGMVSYKRILVEELGWPDVNSKSKASKANADADDNDDRKGGAKTGWAWGLINYLEATKPRTEVKTV